MIDIVNYNDIMKLILLKLQPIELLNVLTIKKDVNFDLNRYFWKKYVESEWGIPKIFAIRFRIFDLSSDKKLYYGICCNCGDILLKYKECEKCNLYCKMSENSEESSEDEIWFLANDDDDDVLSSTDSDNDEWFHKN